MFDSHFIKNDTQIEITFNPINLKILLFVFKHFKLKGKFLLKT